MSDNSSVTESERAKYKADMQVTLNPHDKEQREREEYSKKLEKVNTRPHLVNVF